MVKELHLMTRKVLLVLAIVMLLSAALWVVGAQEEEGHPIVTTASDVVGVGTYVAAEALATAGSEEHPEPSVYILPYGIHPNMHVMDIMEFEQPAPLTEDFTFEWTLDGADLVADGTVAIFLADVEGKYELTLTATDADGNVGEATWEVFATTYIGNGYFSEDPSDMQCINCHEEKIEAWSATGHSDMLVRALNGTLSDHYGPSCVTCHTTGNGMGDNGGFDDLADEYGWELPEELAMGGWDAFVAEFPEVAELANIQCESCHGPGALHPPVGGEEDDEEGGGGPAQPGPISRGLSYGVCAQCHAEDPYHVFPQQWEQSPHGQVASFGFTYPVGEDERDCVRCHSGAGFIDTVNGVAFEDLRVDYQPITCAVCHDPHSVANPNQLRVFDSMTLPDGTEVADAGPAATCMSCHNGRRDGGAAGQVAGFAESGRISMPHHGNNQAELMTVGGGYTWGEALPSSGHDNCIGCHMAATPGMDADGNALPGRHEVGEHTFSMVSADGVENVGACLNCHVGVTTFEYESPRDYDGDGAFETIQEEIAGLREALGTVLGEAGIEGYESERGFTVPEDASEDLLGAFWNYHFTANPGTAVHNFRYAVALLQLSYEKLTGETIGDPLPAR
jgi:hypothetical protein